MKRRNEDEIKGYVQGYNDAFVQFKECLKGRKNTLEAIRKMELFVKAVNSVIEADRLLETQMGNEPQDEIQGLCKICMNYPCGNWDEEFITYKHTVHECIAFEPQTDCSWK